ncbi:MAG: zinc ABC transporter ATP-binding protein, partial [Ilumatobacteraceae bacterium]
MKLVIEHVGFRIDDRVVLDDIQLDVPSGSMVGLVGPNGSG